MRQAASRSPLVQYGAAIAAVLLCFWFRMAFSAVLGSSLPYITFSLAVVFSAWFGGLGPGVAATLLSAALGLYYLADPHRLALPTTSGDWVGLILFLVTGYLISLLIAQLWRARATVASQMQRLEEQAAHISGAGEERRRLVESVSDAFYLVQANFDIAYVNATGAEYARRPREELRTLWDAFPELRGHEFERVARQAMSEAHPATYEFLYSPYGEWFHAAMYPVPEGGLTVFLRNVTEQKLAERRIQKRNELLRLLSSAAERLLHRVSAKQIVPAVFGVAREPLGLDTYLYCVLDPAGGGLVLAACEGLTAEQAAAVEILHFGETAGGIAASEHAPCLSLVPGGDAGSAMGLRVFVSHPLMAGDRLFGCLAFGSHTRDRLGEDEVEFLRTLAHYVEISLERLRLVEAMRQQAALLDFATDAIFSTAPDGTIQFWNRGAEAMYGWTAAEAVGKVSHDLLATVFPRERQEIELEVEKAGMWEGELTHTRKDGSRFAVSSRWAARHVGDSPQGFLEINRDLTERKRLEEKLRQTAKLESLGVLAGGIAHDFNNLLVGVMGNASLASDSLPAAHPVQVLVEQVVLAAERAADLTRQMLAYAGKGRFVVQPVNLSEMVGEISALVRSAIRKNVHLRLELKPDLPLVEADTAQLQQVIMNLVINAAEAIGQKQGTVVVTTAAQEVDEHYLATVAPGFTVKAGMFVTLQVHDTGEGMDEETIAKIFDPFFSTKFQGRGLGLSAVLGIVRSHNGALRVYSAPGQGSTFKIFFPASELLRPPSRNWKHLWSGCAAPGWCW